MRSPDTWLVPVVVILVPCIATACDRTTWGGIEACTDDDAADLNDLYIRGEPSPKSPRRVVLSQTLSEKQTDILVRDGALTLTDLALGPVDGWSCNGLRYSVPLELRPIWSDCHTPGFNLLGTGTCAWATARSRETEAFCGSGDRARLVWASVTSEAFSDPSRTRHVEFELEAKVRVDGSPRTVRCMFWLEHQSKSGSARDPLNPAIPAGGRDFMSRPP